MEMTDERLVDLCLKQDEQAQKLLFDRFAGRMMGVCLRYAQSEEEAKDMLQEGFIKVFQKLEKYNGRGTIGGWIHRIIVNTCLDILRRTHNFKYNESIEDYHEEIHVSADIYNSLKVNDLMKMIEKLPEGYRVVFNMFAIEGYSHKEIAETLGITESTSKSQYRKARINLIRQLKDFDKGVYSNERE